MSPDDLNDSLENLFGPTQGEAPAPRPAAPAWAEQAERRLFVERCSKCGGSGHTPWGRCFRCNGKGGKSFVTSPEQRAHNTAQSHARKARKQEETVAAFAAAHPAVHAWMVEAAPTFPFAAAMVEALAKWGALTEKQLAACERAVAARAARAEARATTTAAAPQADVARVEAAFEAARAHGIRRPKLRLGDFTFKPASASSANAGAIYVTEGDLYLGKVQGGRFLARRECGDERAAKIVEAAADPLAAAQAYGRRFGQCSCCGRELTNGVSIDLGIGPICRSRFGWGE